MSILDELEFTENCPVDTNYLLARTKSPCLGTGDTKTRERKIKLQTFYSLSNVSKHSKYPGGNHKCGGGCRENS
ncbi:hypothetical protein AKJ65_02675 [candidate division MSBL1 archaeon SCGC-AAA259E19]|uniref:Uncharacterized protein n=1 Tax=candidate division MSBL1 archaeon SCGC-AAA259E19 TaxID=1698264 RepID=A0A133ULK2_9EURY|nr:hypothetical protein AKJ65_02675 [candidate division MSBL1 archaeon SCGC-AAA259E19]